MRGRGGFSLLRLPFTHDVFKKAHFGKKLIAGGSTHLSVLVEVFGPKMVGDELAGLEFLFFEVDLRKERVGLFACQFLFGQDSLGVFAVDLKSETGACHSDVIPDFGF